MGELSDRIRTPPRKVEGATVIPPARRLAGGQVHTPVRAPAEFGPPGTVDPMHFLPQGFFSFENRSEYGPTYPTGLPLHLALAGRLVGWRLGPVLVVLG